MAYKPETETDMDVRGNTPHLPRSRHPRPQTVVPAAKANKDGSEYYSLAGPLMLRGKADAKQGGHGGCHLVVVVVA